MEQSLVHVFKDSQKFQQTPNTFKKPPNIHEVRQSNAHHGLLNSKVQIRPRFVFCAPRLSLSIKKSPKANCKSEKKVKYFVPQTPKPKVSFNKTIHESQITLKNSSYNPNNSSCKANQFSYQVNDKSSLNQLSPSSQAIIKIEPYDGSFVK